MYTMHVYTLQRSSRIVEIKRLILFRHSELEEVEVVEETLWLEFHYLLRPFRPLSLRWRMLFWRERVLGVQEAGWLDQIWIYISRRDVLDNRAVSYSISTSHAIPSGAL
jgi:hypothetical protein